MSMRDEEEVWRLVTMFPLRAEAAFLPHCVSAAHVLPTFIFLVGDTFLCFCNFNYIVWRPSPGQRYRLSSSHGGSQTG